MLEIWSKPFGTPLRKPLTAGEWSKLVGITSIIKTSQPGLDHTILGRCKNLEVARVPEQVAPRVKTRLNKIGRILDFALESREAEEVFSLLAGIVHDVGIGVHVEVLHLVHRRAMRTQLSANDHDDLVAAAELTDLVHELENKILEETGNDDGDHAARAHA